MEIKATGLPETVEDYQVALNAAFEGGKAYGTAKSEQEQGEPVAVRQSNGEIHVLGSALVPIGAYLYTTPQQRTWVGLTDEDKMAFLAQDFGGNRLDAMDWAEERLKEKNNVSQ